MEVLEDGQVSMYKLGVSNVLLSIIYSVFILYELIFDFVEFGLLSFVFRLIGYYTLSCTVRLELVLTFMNMVNIF